MKYYIFNTEQEAINYDAEVTQARRLHNGDNHDNPRKHPTLNKWAVLAHIKVSVEGQESQELTEDWFES